jgi:outer membrane murein-binding lipoprotein Lpp
MKWLLAILLMTASVAHAEPPEIDAASETNQQTSALDKARAANRRLVTRIRKLELQIRQLTDELEAARRDARHAKSDLAALNTRLAAQAIDGKIDMGPSTPGKFLYGNDSAIPDGKHIELVGEIENRTGRDWLSASFQIAAYDDSGGLLGVTTFTVTQLSAGAVKAYDAKFFDVAYRGAIRYKYSFEGGFEAE